MLTAKVRVASEMLNYKLQFSVCSNLLKTFKCRNVYIYNC